MSKVKCKICGTQIEKTEAYCVTKVSESTGKKTNSYYCSEQEYLEAIESLLLENDISSKHILRFLSLLSKNKERLDELLEQIYEQANLKK